MSAQVAFNSQRINTKDNIGGSVESDNIQPRDRQGSPRKLDRPEDSHHHGHDNDELGIDILSSNVMCYYLIYC